MHFRRQLHFGHQSTLRPKSKLSRHWMQRHVKNRRCRNVVNLARSIFIMAKIILIRITKSRSVIRICNSDPYLQSRSVIWIWSEIWVYDRDNFGQDMLKTTKIYNIFTPTIFHATSDFWTKCSLDEL